MSALETMPNIQDAGLDLASKTVCITVNMGVMGNSRQISNSAVEVEADKDRIKVHKKLLDSPELAAITKANNELRRYLYDVCLPFDLGVYLLPLGLVETVENRLQSFRRDWERLVSRFLEQYPRLCREASIALRGLYNPGDYPDVAEVRSRFSLSWRYISFGTPESLKTISDKMFQEERQKASDRMREASEEITAVMRASLLELTSHLRDRLTPGQDGKPKILRDSAITNLSEFLSTFDLRNVTGDSELSAIAAKCRETISGISPELLRNVSRYREQVQSDMSTISSELGKLVSDKPSRKFRGDDN
jgi:hypothetical protein